MWGRETERKRDVDGQTLGYCIYGYYTEINIHSFSFIKWLYGLFLGPGLYFSSVIFSHGRRTPWSSDQLVARPLPTHRTTQTQNKRRKHPCLRVGFEPTIPAFERAKTVHALNGAATVISWIDISNKKSKEIMIIFAMNFIHQFVKMYTLYHV
jgi:hypothetical protein